MIRSIIIFSIAIFSISASGFELQLWGTTTIKHNTKFQGTTLGGLSGLSYEKGDLYAVSDDTGKISEPRLYKMKLDISGKSPEMTPQAVIKVDPKRNYFSKEDFLDMEGLAGTGKGHLLVSTEGRGNAIPRQASRIFQVDLDGKVQREFSIPSYYHPDKLGEQKQGHQNNLGFEGLALSQDKTKLYAATEASLYQDELKDDRPFFRILVWNQALENKKTESAMPQLEWLYTPQALSQTDKGFEVFRSVSAILEVSANKLLVVERGLRISKTLEKSYTGGVFLVDFNGAENSLGKFGEELKNFKFPEKKLLVNFEALITDRAVQNFESLSWGPDLPDGRRTLLVLSDNNFTKKEVTELLVFAVKP